MPFAFLRFVVKKELQRLLGQSRSGVRASRRSLFMGRIVILGLLVVLVALPVGAADEPDPEPPAADAKKLLGSWEIVSIAQAGKPLRVVKGNGWMMTLEKKRMTMLIVRRRFGTWKIDPRKNPKQIDLTALIFGGDAAIYKVHGDQLIIASNNGGNDRPRDFASAQITMILRRKK
jgi:uncharacterized protein (TIGR03067 family)